jgi:hypothetical protein
MRSCECQVLLKNSFGLFEAVEKLVCFSFSKKNFT